MLLIDWVTIILFRRENARNEVAEDRLEQGAAATRGHLDSASEQCRVILLFLLSLVMAYFMAWVLDAAFLFVEGGALDPAAFSNSSSSRKTGAPASGQGAPGCSGGLDDAVAGSIGGVVGVVVMLVLFALIQLCRHFGWISEQQAGKKILRGLFFKFKSRCVFTCSKCFYLI